MNTCHYCQKYARTMQRVAALLRQAQQTTKPERVRESVDNALRVMGVGC